MFHFDCRLNCQIYVSDIFFVTTQNAYVMQITVIRTRECPRNSWISR